ncbi:hypothetical protein A3C91_03180 [Candidatus Azambacteria bacterium RIFCSPHIGHO2_02_FULL_52_12]|uniref:Peptidase M50 domain-containing protein n=1 Tax=Candidatus Azambacteria bacterium RIFCSPLOWO2_01_FULL_46_25 TaxID=1797298 RepID=A0A1F5BU71_9BACT|nr:MAG: hypothetical protein A3C91_03180 [Candidatus Azambacteria bacterium RIFCSPHIGHO2_02_FULL_52_12]OGD34150.1 MAG: hypothetical protein A2988_01575 [Candidatus Azambacteria bacterium RIFCSPLOWO2_01_FULL_46_25]OGD36749.1 MAG: hypothetical protein A2850_00530 [Candidatus Azambacteria bacterium RIFCSPHIGHO2_01_FULL_51_74]
MDIQMALFQIVVLIFSAVVHEVSHGFVANALGDPTAKNMGRLTLNPLKHLEWFGSFLLPLLMYFGTAGRFMFGWAKPVPYNPSNLKDPRWDSAYIACAGPLANFSIAIVFGLLLRFVPFSENTAFVLLPELFTVIVFINILLGVFNLVPIPPLDGSKVLFAFLGNEQEGVVRFLEQNGLMLLLLFMFFGFGLIMPIIDFLFSVITGFRL